MTAVGLDPHDATPLSRARGADLEVVQEQLGHASIKTTTIHAKGTKEDMLLAANALAKLFRDSQQNGNSVAGWPLRFPEMPEKGHELLRLSEVISSCLKPEARQAAGLGPRMENRLPCRLSSCVYGVFFYNRIV